MCSCNNEKIKSIMINLKVIGKIKPGCKLNSKEKYLKVDDSTIYQWVLRKYRGDSRHVTIERVTCVIHDAIHLIHDALKNPNASFLNVPAAEFIEKMHEFLVEAGTGLENLQDHYINDTTISTQLEMDKYLLEQCILKIKKNKNPAKIK